MKKVPMVEINTLQREESDARAVTSLAVDRSKTRPVFYLTLKCYQHGEEDARSLDFALSPPAAKQLAGLLEQAVDDYLHGNQVPEFSLDAFVGGTE